jgi:hypothetical protein
MRGAHGARASSTGPLGPTQPELDMSASIARRVAPATRPLPLLTPARRRLRSVGAVLGAVVANGLVSLVIDQLFHVLGVYPAWGQPMNEVSDNVLALGYRVVIGVAGGWLAARLAPRNPMRHALAYGAVGVVLSAIGATVAITRGDLGPAWYPLLLVVVAMPCAWAGGKL